MQFYFFGHLGGKISFTWAEKSQKIHDFSAQVFLTWAEKKFEKMGGKNFGNF